MMRPPQTPRTRTGATTVETAFVISIFLLFVFGIFEYSRFVMVYNGMENATREGSRYAACLVNVDQSTTADIQAQVRQRLQGVDPDTSKFTITVSGMVLRDGTYGTPINWQDAKATDGIVVQVDYNYTPSLPNFLMMDATIPMRTKSVMYSEAN